jgi:hypothetical protein
LAFNLRDKKWWLPIAHQIYKGAKDIEFDHIGGFLRARVIVEVANPLRRCILIESAKRQCMDMYDVQYEQIPHFYFSCGRLGHSNLLCHNPGTQDAAGNLPYGKRLRAPEEKRRSSYSEGSTGDYSSAKAETRGSSNVAGKGVEATSPLKKNIQTNVNGNKRNAGAQAQQYRRVQTPPLAITQVPHNSDDMNQDSHNNSVEAGLVVVEDANMERGPKKKKPIPTSSENLAEAARQPCQEQ